MIGHMSLGPIAQQGGGAGGGGGPGAPGNGWTLSPTFLRTGFTLSEGNRRVTNNVGIGNSAGYAESVEAFEVVDQVYYWEGECINGANANVGIGCILTTTEPKDNDTDDNLGAREKNWVYSQGLFITSGGASTSVASFGGLDTGDVMMLAFNPSTGEIWVGENGVWANNPDVDPASYTVSELPELGEYYRMVIVCKPFESAVQLITDPSELNYSVPSTAVAIDTVSQPSVASVDQSMIYTVTEE